MAAAWIFQKSSFLSVGIEVGLVDLLFLQGVAPLKEKDAMADVEYACLHNGIAQTLSGSGIR